jgi:cation diffusion facilitator family transporter
MATDEQMPFPKEQQDALAKAKRLEWLSLGYTAFTVTIVAFVLGNSQAMKTAWVEDMLSTLPQISFLIAAVFIGRSATQRHPYGFHRAMNVGHLVGSVALIVVGTILAYEAVSGLVRVEHPAIGTIRLFGSTLWQGWVMVAIMAVIAVPPVFLARAKMKVARKLHNKLLFADADMSKADWSTNVGSIIGVLGIGIGWWWADGAAALFISAGILRDGLRNTKFAVLDLMDESATTYDQRKPHPLIQELAQQLVEVAWIKEAGIRIRDQGHVFHAEAFVVPISDRVTTEELNTATRAGLDLNWKLQDLVIIPVRELPPNLHEANTHAGRG